MDRSADNIGQIINQIQRDLEELKTTQLRNEDIPAGAITTPKLADGAVTTAKIADGAVDSDKIGSASVALTNMLTSSFSSTEGAWSVYYMPNGKKIWLQSGQSTTSAYNAGPGNWGYAQNIASLPSSVESISDVHVLAWVSGANGSGSTKVAVVHGALVGGDGVFGISATELYGSGSGTTTADWSIMLIEK